MISHRTTLTAEQHRPSQALSRRLLGSNGFAWTLSLALHGLVFAVLYVAVWRDAAPVRRAIIPEARLAPAPGPAAPAETIPLQLTREPVDTPADPRLQLEDAPIAALALDRDADLALPSIEPNATSALLNPASGGPSAVQAPVSSFFGQAGNAYRVVYVVDTSASLMIYIDEIVRQMKESIRALLPTQRFHIVLAKPRQVVELDTRRVVPAITRYKHKANVFLDAIDRIPQPGKADPIEAMKRAFAVKPELIYFLSDGDYSDVAEDLEKTLARLNADKSVAITTIGFDPSPGPRALLERIARENGGHFRAVEPR